jgi:hypothetical protein
MPALLKASDPNWPLNPLAAVVSTGTLLPTV